MKKICILSTVNIKHMTLISLYTDFLDSNNIDYDIIYIDKYGDIEETNAKNVYRYKLSINRSWNKYRKAIKYWGFRSFAKNILNANKYDFIITWNIITAFMFSDILSKEYKERYCINIRDIEPNPLINMRLRQAVTNAAFPTVSSSGFIPFLPKADYIETHSLNMKVLKSCIPHTSLKAPDKPIVITYIGYMCYYDYCYKLIDVLGNDSRYHMNFYGQGSELIEKYITDRGIENVTCRGRFESSETACLIQDSDIIYNLYGIENINLRTALSIKLYYAAYLNVPILVFKNTYMADISEKYHFGYSINIDDFNTLADDLYHWYHKLSQDDISIGCKMFEEKIMASNNVLFNKMKEFLLGDI